MCVPVTSTLSGQGTADWSTVVRSARPAVVTLKTYDVAGQLLGLGSGFRLPDGRIATNVHVLGGAARVEAFDATGELLGTVTYAEAVSTSVDIAVLPSLGPLELSLPLAPAEPEVGESVIAIGSPEGLSATVSDGLISAFRNWSGRRLMQISAPISPGSSGGPVLNRAGQVVGVSVSLLGRGQNLNFAVPLKSLRAVVASPRGRLAFPSEATAEASPTRAASSEDPVAADVYPDLPMNEAIRGELTAGDPPLSTGNRATGYHFKTVRGHRYTIAATAEIDVSLLVLGVGAADTAEFLASDDDGLGGTNPMVLFTAPRTGHVAVFITNYEPADLGAFRITAFEGDQTRQLRAAYDTSAEGRWVRAAGNDSRTLYLDRRTLSVASSGYVQAWVHAVLAELQESESGAYDNVRAQVEIDCLRHRFRYLQSMFYNGNSVVNQLNKPTSWSADVPGTIGETFIRTACALAKHS